MKTQKEKQKKDDDESRISLKSTREHKSTGLLNESELQFLNDLT